MEGDLWRLENWLEHSAASLGQLLRRGVPTSIEQLEEVIQDHREFLLQVSTGASKGQVQPISHYSSTVTRVLR